MIDLNRLDQEIENLLKSETAESLGLWLTQHRKKSKENSLHAGLMAHYALWEESFNCSVTCYAAESECKHAAYYDEGDTFHIAA